MNNEDIVRLMGKVSPIESRIAQILRTVRNSDPDTEQAQEILELSDQAVSAFSEVRQMFDMDSQDADNIAKRAEMRSG